MSKISFNPNFLSYKEWARLNPGVEEQEEECDICEGGGEEECFHCGSDMECNACGGTGVVKTGKVLYERQLTQDKRVLKKYQDWLDRAVEHSVQTESGDGTTDNVTEKRTTDV